MIPARSYCAVTHTHTLLASMISHEHQNRFEELIPMFGVCDECSFPHVAVGSEVIVCPVIALFGVSLCTPPFQFGSKIWLNLKTSSTISEVGGSFKKNGNNVSHSLMSFKS